MATIKFEKLSNNLSYTERGKEITLATKTISAAKAAFLASFAKSEKLTDLQKSFYNFAVEFDKLKDTFDIYCKYMDKKYKGITPKKGYSYWYIWQFFDKGANVCLSWRESNEKLYNLACKYLRVKRIEEQKNNDK